MQPASVVPFTVPAACTDPLGTRLVINERPGERLEQLRFAPALLSGNFEAALRERVAQLAQFRHPCFARVRRIDRLESGTALAVVSDQPRGARLSHVLAVAERDGIGLDINAALCIVRQLVPAIAALHQAAPGAAHGALSPDRIVVTPHARIVITEHVVGSAIEQLQLSRVELWRDLGIMTPPGADSPPRLDRRADVVQIGAVSLALVLGRPVRVEELETLGELLASARETTVLGRKELVAAPLRRWLLRALHLDPRGSFQSAADAQAGLEDVLSEEGGYIAAPIALESFLMRYQERAAMPSLPPPAAEPRPAVVRATLVPQAAGAARTTAPPSASPAPQENDTVAIERARDSDAVDLLASSDEAGAEDVHPAGATAVVARMEPAIGASEGSGEVTANERTDLKRFLDSDSAPATPPHESARPVKTRDDGSGQAHATMPDLFKEPAPVSRSRRERVALVLCALVAIGEAAYIWASVPLAAPTAVGGKLTIDSRPSGATVVIDDRERGVTPLALSLSAGPHVLALRTAGGSRAVPLTIEAGVAQSQYLELAPVATTGAIDVLAETPGARVLLDGQPRGVAPMTLADVTPGDHDLVIESSTGVVRQRVAVQAGLTTSVRPGAAVPAPAPEPIARLGDDRGAVRDAGA